MKETSNYLQKIKQFYLIMVPIFIAQIGSMLIIFSDTVMSGRAGASDLAGVAIGSSLLFPFIAGFTGMLLSITPIIAQHVGAKQKDKIPETVQQGIYLSTLLALLVLLLGFLFVKPTLNLLDLTVSDYNIAKDYLIGISFGIIPLFIHTVFRCFFDALGETRVTMIITLISLPINVFFNYLLIFGSFGFPKLGGAGAGYASAITYWIVIIIAISISKRFDPFKPYQIMRNWVKISLNAWKEQLKIGVPIGLSIFFEVSIFAVVTLFMSEFDTFTIAAHQAAINFASLLFMIPLSISMALTIAVGHEVGANRLDHARQYSNIGISSAALIAFLTAIILYLFNGEIASIYTNNPQVLELMKHFLLYAIFFQFADAIGAPVQGVLRGYKDVNISLMMTFVSYWLIGIPVGLLAENYTNLGPFGYWVGLITGLTVGAIGLTTRLVIVQRKHKNSIQVQ
ncbi:MATE family efflux transporter [Lottiidibacillus patelloidae]|uniref:Probable multidrug resistance protein NorM n=1 Tax=Lottiidibacillus patelloidae TaxID=2670334 RepID=A0A263BR85_9BACI|nr:MATE family efflux transporter [Lottiidibacillus patelloidae]OZM56219.1 MATE family efflux transporter [Lottiidibacillus patelloidae]